MKLIAYFILSISIFLSGCSAFKVKQHYLGDKAGYLSASVGITKGSDKDPSYRIHFIQKDAPFEEYSVGVMFENMWGDTLPDISDDKKEVVVFAKRLKPGEYSITGWEAVIYSGSTTITYSSKKSFNKNFEVIDGEVTYLDQFLFHTYWRKEVGLFGKRPQSFALVNSELTEEEKALSKVRIQEVEKERLTK